MVGDEHVDAAGRGFGDAFMARDAVVDGDQQPRRARGRKRDDFRREPVPELESIGHDVVHVGAQRAQPEHAHCAGGGAVRIIVRDDHDALAIADRLRKPLGRRIDTLERRETRQRG